HQLEIGARNQRGTRIDWPAPIGGYRPTGWLLIVLVAGDGPRVMPELPTIAPGARVIFNFDLVLILRTGGVHSGHWGGLTTDPAVVLSHALASIMDRRGKILVRDWLPRTPASNFAAAPDPSRGAF